MEDVMKIVLFILLAVCLMVIAVCIYVAIASTIYGYRLNKWVAMSKSKGISEDRLCLITNGRAGTVGILKTPVAYPKVGDKVKVKIYDGEGYMETIEGRFVKFLQRGN
jgi:hypothetical protein